MWAQPCHALVCCGLECAHTATPCPCVLWSVGTATVCPCVLWSGVCTHSHAVPPCMLLLTVCVLASLLPFSEELKFKPVLGQSHVIIYAVRFLVGVRLFLKVTNGDCDQRSRKCPACPRGRVRFLSDLVPLTRALACCPAGASWTRVGSNCPLPLFFLLVNEWPSAWVSRSCFHGFFIFCNL